MSDRKTYHNLNNNNNNTNNNNPLAGSSSNNEDNSNNINFFSSPHANSNPEPFSSSSSSPMSRPGSASVTSDPHYNQQLTRLRAFYSKYDPARVPHAEITLRTWRGSYDIMWSKLTTKYGPEPGDDEEMTTRPGGMNISALAAATMAAQKLSPHRNRGTSSPAPAAYVGRSDVNYRARLQRFYAMYAPHRLPTVDKALEIFRGKEESLFDSLRRKFGQEPPQDYPVPEIADVISGMDQPTTSLVQYAGAADTNSVRKSEINERKASQPYGNASGDYTSDGTTRVQPMDSSYNTDTQPANARGKPVNLSQFGNDLGSNNNNNNNNDDDQKSEPIDWEGMCSCCDDCTDSLKECLQSNAMEKVYKWFYVVAFACAVIGAIVTALILVGVNRNLVVFKQTKSTSELDLTQLYGPGLYTWGVNTRGIEFPTTLKRVSIRKDVVCCGGQNIFLSKTFFWTIRDQDSGTEVNLTELADMITAFGSLPEDKLIVQAQEAFSDTIAAWSQNMSLDQFVSNRTAIEDAAHIGLIQELRRNKIYVAVPRRFFNLGHIEVPSSYSSQKRQVFENNQSIATASFREQATAYRLGTTQIIRDIDANTTLVRTQASANATRLKDIAVSTNAARDLQNIANAVAQMSIRVNATGNTAAINLFRLNELLDIVEIEPDTSFFVNVANGKSVFPLI